MFAERNCDGPMFHPKRSPPYFNNNIQNPGAGIPGLNLIGLLPHVEGNK
jgi:hypothetical protein